MKEVKFYKCPICGNVIELIDGNINHMMCCGRAMEELIADTVDASLEKHVPAYEINNDEIIVKIGEVEHPMEEKHYIMWIALVNDNRIIRYNLTANDKALVKFPYVKNSIVYAYCNLHGLWKKEII